MFLANQSITTTFTHLPFNHLLSQLSYLHSPSTFSTQPPSTFPIYQTLTGLSYIYHILLPAMYPRRSPASPPPPVWLTWKNWESVAVGISDLPREANTKILWEAFSKEGNIFSIDIFEDRNGNRSSRGRVRFKYVLRRSHLPTTWIPGYWKHKLTVLQTPSCQRLLVGPDISPKAAQWPDLLPPA